MLRFCLSANFRWSSFCSSDPSYSEEEVRTARSTSWVLVKPALRYGAIGKIPAVSSAEGGVLDALQNPERYLKAKLDTLNPKP